MPIAAHYKATRAMARVQELLREQRTLAPSHTLLTALSCAGVAVVRRIGIAHEQDVAADLQTTLSLLLVLIVLATGDATVPAEYADHPDAYDADGEERAAACGDYASCISSYESDSLSAVLEAAATACSTNADWGAVVNAPPEPEDVCRAILWIISYRGRSFDLAAIWSLSVLFFRLSAAATATSLFESVAPGSFVSMSVGQALQDAHRDERLAAIVSAAESEAGQTVLRDLQLSFLLPRSVVGVRRAVLLPRATNAIITKDHAAVLNAAHESALRGAEWEWAHSTSPIVRMCALLAGLAVLVSKTGDIRKEDAFAGHVALPFLETLPPQSGVPRLALIEARGDWVCWRQRAGRQADIDVLVRRPGYEGLFDAVLVFSSVLNRG